MDHGTILDCRQAVMCDATGSNEYWQGESNKQLAPASTTGSKILRLFRWAVWRLFIYFYLIIIWYVLDLASTCSYCQLRGWLWCWGEQNRRFSGHSWLGPPRSCRTGVWTGANRPLYHRGSGIAQNISHLFALISKNALIVYVNSLIGCCKCLTF